MMPTFKEVFDWIERGPHTLSHFEISRRKYSVINWLNRNSNYNITLLTLSSYQQLLDLAQLEMCNMYGAWRIERTPRQKEVQRLWQQRGLLERTKANLSNVDTEQFKHRMAPLPFSNGLLSDTIRYIDRCIEINKQNMATVSERIPKV